LFVKLAGEKMKNPVMVISMSEMGSVFARGFRRVGHPVFPVVRGMDMASVAAVVNAPELVLIAVAEADLHSVLQHIPSTCSERLELLPKEL